MVRYNQAYIGSTHINLIYAGDKHVKRIYKGSELVYQYGWNPVTFNPSGSLQTFTVPAGTKKIHIDCVASKGALAAGDRIDQTAGNGGRVQCDINVTSGQTLYVMVGSIPSDATVPSYNASDIRIGGTDYGNRIVVAGGGGSGRHTSNRNYGGSGGAGGGLIGGDGTSASTGRATGGYGGTQSAGGSGGWGRSASGASGSLGIGGVGGSNTGSAGGAGYYGGGGGGYGGHDGSVARGGGGGGSSYTNGTYCSNVIHTQGYRNGAGYVTISYVEV